MMALYELLLNPANNFGSPPFQLILPMIFEHHYKREPLRLSSAHPTNPSNFLDSTQTTNALQQDCLVRLRKQREKIEQAAQRNEQLQKEVGRLKEEKEGLVEIVEELRGLEVYREKYEALRVEFQRMLDSHQMAEYEIDEFKAELEKNITSWEEETERLKGVIRQQKEANSMHVGHLEAVIAEKDEKTQRMKREAKAKEEQLIAKNEMLKQQNQRLRECLMQQGVQLEQNQEMLKKQLKTKELGLAGSEKYIEQLKKQIKSLKFEIQELKFEHSKEVEEYKELIDQTRAGLKLLMREKEAKEHENVGLKDQLKRYEAKCKSLEEKFLAMKENMNKWKNKVDQNQAKREQANTNEQQKLLQVVLRLRKQNQKHVEDYNLLSIQLKRAKSIIQQKDSHINRRKSLKKP